MSQLVTTTAGGIRWQVLSKCREQLLGPRGLRLDEWLGAGQAQVVKLGPRRIVYAVSLPGLRFFVKHNRLADTRDWLRQLLRPGKARIEHQRAVAMALRRVPTFKPLALGEASWGLIAGDTYLITQDLEGAPLDVFLQRVLPRMERARQVRLRQRLAAVLGRFLAHMHQAGVIHDDLHPGNLLIRLDGNDQPFLHLIDLHAIRLGRPLSWRDSRANLAMLNRWFVLRVGRADRLRFWCAYFEARPDSRLWPRAPGTTSAQMMKLLARDLEQQTWRSNLGFWRQRDRRCLATNRYYRQVRSAGVAGHAVADLDTAALGPLLADPDEPFRRPGVKLLKDSPSSTVAELNLSVGGVVQRVIYKRFRLKSRGKPWLGWLRTTPAVRSWILGHGLRERCLPTARPLAVLHRRVCGLPREGYLVTAKIADAVDLHQYLNDLHALPDAKRRVSLRCRIDQVARLVRELHRCRLSHRDLKAANILVDNSCNHEVFSDAAQERPLPGRFYEASLKEPLPGIWLIDLVGMNAPRRLRRGRLVQNLARLNASVGGSPALTRADKLRFLRVYMQWGLCGNARWKDWWRAIERATLLKVERNRRNGRPLG
jgi:tRNA A-37 threonylcarbamoyl transferase component Bud32